MRYYVYETELFMEAAKKHNCTSDIKKLKDKIHIEQSIGTFERYLPTPFIRKYIGSNFRLIAVEKWIEDVDFVCFIKLLPRGSKEYKDWLDNKDIFNDQIPSQTDLLNIYLQLKEKKDEELPGLTTEEYEYLLTMHPESAETEEIIVESKDWVELINKSDYEPYKLQIRDMISEVIENKSLYGQKIEIKESKYNIHIMYKYFLEWNKLFLVAPFIINKTETNIVEKIKEEYLFLNKITAFEDIIRHSRKSYPSYVLLDDDIWLNIQKNSEGNLALSPEENAILTQIRTNIIGKARYPVFINGRPGSGKSTILQYLFSDVIHYKLKDNASVLQTLGLPIYLTYNENLLTVAKKTIRTILKCNVDKVVNKNINLDTYVFIEMFEKCFSTFQNMLLSLLDEKELPTFKIDGYVDYSKFKELWNRDIPRHPDTYIRKKLNPESAWHVIRTYIKGMSFNDKQDFDDEAYKNELARDQKSISDELFKNIYNKVWKGWYRPLLINENLWDDQDLARYVIDSKKNLAKYTAVFCDEAQDFTKIELEIIINLNYFKMRSIAPDIIKNIPYAFAGDPFQTLNPTGFNWESVKANFHEKIIKELDKSGKSKLQLNYFELAFNYRSTKSIVGFSNLIQILRGSLFEIKNLVPQKTWFDDEVQRPQFFFNNSLAIEDKIRGQEEIVIIIPCQAGEELEWVKSDPILREFAISDGKLIRNILSPMRAKGLEFNRVVLYNFGDQAAIDYEDIMLEKAIYENEKALLANPEEQLRFEYFINNLYVGASRPKYSLLIVDSKKGYDTFWGVIKNNYTDLLEHYMSNLSTQDEWKEDYISIFEDGNTNAWEEYKDEPIFLARSFERQGVHTKNVEDLKMAEQNYSRAKKYGDEKRVKALRLFYSADYKESGELYQSLSSYDDALKSFWLGKNYSNISELTKLNTRLGYTPEANASEFMLENDNYSKAQKFLKQLYDDFQNNNSKQNMVIEFSNSSTWMEVIYVLIKTLSKYVIYENNTQLSKSINHQILNSFGPFIKKDSFYDLALIKYCADSKKEAIEMWESTEGAKYPVEYYIAKSEFSTFPENIIWCSKAGNNDSILFIFNENRENIDKINEEALNILINVLIHNNNHEELIYLLDNIDVKKIKHPALNIEILIDIAVKNNKYDKIIMFIASIYQESIILNNIRTTKKSDVKRYGILMISQTIKYLENNSIKQLLQFISTEKANNKTGFTKIHRIINVLFLEHLLALDLESTKLDNKLLEDISKYIHEVFVDSSKTWDNEYDIYSVLIIFEKYGRIIDALSFYESLYRNQDNMIEIMKISKERWVKVKHRQGVLYNNQKNREDAQTYFKEWKLFLTYNSISDIPEYGTYITKCHSVDLNILLDLVFDTPKNIIENESQIIMSKKPTIPTQEDKLEEQIINKKECNYEFAGVINFDNKIKFDIEHKPQIGKTRIRYSNGEVEEMISILHSKKLITGEVEFVLNHNMNGVYYNNEWKLLIEFKDAWVNISYIELEQYIISLKI